MRGRYYVLIIEGAENILELTVLDENGNEFKQTDSFSVFGVKNDRVKIYVDKKKGVPFSIKLKRAKLKGAKDNASIIPAIKSASSQ